jgi:hypothetical protein
MAKAEERMYFICDELPALLNAADAHPPLFLLVADSATRFQHLRMHPTPDGSVPSILVSTALAKLISFGHGRQTAGAIPRRHLPLAVKGIADRLQMGTWTQLNHLLCCHRRKRPGQNARTLQ